MEQVFAFEHLKHNKHVMNIFSKAITDKILNLQKSNLNLIVDNVLITSNRKQLLNLANEIDIPVNTNDSDEQIRSKLLSGLAFEPIAIYAVVKFWVWIFRNVLLLLTMNNESTSWAKVYIRYYECHKYSGLDFLECFQDIDKLHNEHLDLLQAHQSNYSSNDEKSEKSENQIKEEEILKIKIPKLKNYTIHEYINQINEDKKVNKFAMYLGYLETILFVLLGLYLLVKLLKKSKHSNTLLSLVNKSYQEYKEFIKETKNQ